MLFCYQDCQSVLRLIFTHFAITPKKHFLYICTKSVLFMAHFASPGHKYNEVLPSQNEYYSYLDQFYRTYQTYYQTYPQSVVSCYFEFLPFLTKMFLSKKVIQYLSWLNEDLKHILKIILTSTICSINTPMGKLIIHIFFILHVSSHVEQEATKACSVAQSGANKGTSSHLPVHFYNSRGFEPATF